jgi:hypothetical protein
MGTIAWPIDQRPQFSVSPPWQGGIRGGAKTSISMNLLGNNINVTYTKISEERFIDLIGTTAYLCDQKQLTACDVYYLNMLSPRNTNRLNTFEVAQAYIRRDASSIKHINLDQVYASRLRNIVSDTQMIALAWLIYDRQNVEVFTDATVDFRLTPHK